MSIVLNALFPEQQPDVWKELRALLPKAPIVAHGMNNSNQLLPLGGGLDAQKAYIRKTIDLIEKETGVRVRGWQSPSVYPNADTFTATVAEGITFTLDSMDSDILSRLSTTSGPLVLIPYPTTTVDMGQYLVRSKEPSDMERLWIDYVDELASEAEADPSREATVLVIGIHPFVMGTPAGAAALRRVLDAFQAAEAGLGHRCRSGADGRGREALATARRSMRTTSKLGCEFRRDRGGLPGESGGMRRLCDR